MPPKDTSLLPIIKSALSKGSITDLSEEEMNVLNMATLLVDVQYHRKYSRPIVAPDGKDYIEAMQQILPDQQSPVDDTLEGIGRREIIDG